MDSQSYTAAKKAITENTSDRPTIENALLDRCKREWSTLSDQHRQAALVLARRYNRETEFSTLTKF